MVIFDATLPGTPAETWNSDPRLWNRPALRLEGVDELIVVAAHPDDETLGAGGLIAECSRRGIPVTVVVVTDGGAAGLAAIRQHELEAATAILGARVVALGFPDGATREHADEIRTALAPLLFAASRGALIAAPWRGDGHRDHRIVGEAVAALAGDLRVVEYPIWAWHWGEPDFPEIPWEAFVSLPVDGTKRRALAEYRSQSGLLTPDFLRHFHRGIELFVAREALAPEYFDATYARNDDPWRYETRWYEARKRSLTLAALPGERYGTALEIGCSIGLLTEQLADRCNDLLAVDVSASAVAQTRARVGDRVRVEQADVLERMPPGPFDLVLLSEVGYYFGPAGLERVLDGIEAGLTANGTFVACHWRHPVADYPMSGDEVHAAISARGLHLIATHSEEDFLLDVYSRDDRSVARRTGLL